ncbi:serine hydrolase domain-containing protein [Stenotrophomonas sp.]|uniref:serine hydrolase domain-containing protein n=1 Tax=Stenotrophomonas sp. TaxID=69392 RepID=UPI0028ACFB99|nr:serine hydrolase domain-containing protein [Stenotrophomonas sp.]
MLSVTSKALGTPVFGLLRIRFIVVSIVLMLLVPSASAQELTLEVQSRIARVEQGLSSRVVVKDAPDQKMSLAARMAFHDVPAVSIALINNGRVEWARAYGVLDVDRRRPATTESLFQAGSVSKSISALGALRLVEQGKLSLDGSANEQLGSWKIPDNRFTQQRPVTLRDLLNHSAGMNIHGFNGYAQGEAVPSLLQVLDGVPPANSEPVRVEAIPGTEWKYSGGGYTVVQLMMAEACGKLFPELMRELVLGPLDMKDSTFATTLQPIWKTRAGIGHHTNGEPVSGGWHVYPESAAAALWSTPTDLAKVVIDIQQAQSGKPGKVLSSAMTTMMLSRGLGEYGLGLYVEKLGEGISFAHSGGTDGFRSQLYGYTHTGQGVVVMTNSDNGAALIDEILVSVSAEYGWPEFQITEKVALPSDPVANAKLVGNYILVDKPAQVVAEGDHLYLRSELFGERPMQLFAQSKNQFFMTAQDMTVEFQQVGNDKAKSFSLKRGNNTYIATSAR